MEPQTGEGMSIFDDPIMAANWLSTCEADKLRKDTARYEREQDPEVECVGCGGIFPQSEISIGGACATCWDNRTKDEDD